MHRGMQIQQTLQSLHLVTQLGIFLTFICSLNGAPRILLLNKEGEKKSQMYARQV